MVIFLAAVFIAQHVAFLDGTLLAHARHILVETEDEVVTLYREIHESKHIELKFIRFARTHSQCSLSDRNGDIGYVKQGQMGPELNAILFEKELHTVHKVYSPLGWHLLYIIERIDAEALREREQQRSLEKKWLRVIIDAYNNLNPYIGPLILMILVWIGVLSASSGPKSPATKPKEQ
uniref:Peptidyl-prolyl cis-trans isomerase n=1 Tax=Albugo laibachii Nc14 TaxID=890382 RepID=F0WGN2_9STRA|nr:PpiCtype peptidylprolyl cistrans isomerase putative [Albugo laibachii Nc14]|eukprot:CCA20396.1 PpiCtype peptidylprolyl cistrans isomerase putative [Albugo laibachii Nc14]